MSIPDDILELKALVRQLLDRISALEVENAALKAENAELKARLNLDSHNSSKPPSSDGLLKKPAFPREKNGKQGGQQNHNGNTLKMVNEPDFTVICKTDKCSCGCDLTKAPATIIARRQKFDLPEPRLGVTEYCIAQNTCPQCGKQHRGEFPEGINAPAQYGTGVKALVTLLNSEYKLPFKKIQTLFQDCTATP